MLIEIVMPKMGESVTEGTIIKWHKKIGDAVKKDEIIFEISTDKVDTEIPSQSAGTIAKILFNEGETVEVGKVVAMIETDSCAKIETPASSVAPEVKLAPQMEKKIDEPKIEIAKPSPVASIDFVNVPMPKMGESVMEGTIIKWHKKVGDVVKKDETIFEISTDKVDTEVPSPANGILAEIIVNEQETVSVGTIVAKISTQGKVVPHKAQTSSAHDQIAATVNAQVEPSSPKFETPKMDSQKIVEEIKEKGSKFYSPLVMNIAQKENVTFQELETITGTGLGGRVSKNDIFAYIANRAANRVQTEIAKPTQPQPKPAPSFTLPPISQKFEAGKIEQIPMDNIRQKIMYHMVNSRDTSVHVSAVVEVDMSAVHNFMTANKEKYLRESGLKLTYMAFISNAVVKVLQQHSLVNSSIDGSNINIKKYVNLGIAVAIEPNGLIVPNIKNAHEKNVLGLAKGIAELAEKARTKKLSPDDIMGGTFTITNYGSFGTIIGTPIINQPEVAILGVGAITKRPVVMEVNGTDTIAIKPMMYLTLAHDHRLVDGMLGGLFLKSVKENLENFNPANL